LKSSKSFIESGIATVRRNKELRRKAKVLDLFTNDKTLGTVFRFEFRKATDLIFSRTFAERATSRCSQIETNPMKKFATSFSGLLSKRVIGNKSDRKYTITGRLRRKVMHEKVVFVAGMLRTPVIFLGAASIVSLQSNNYLRSLINESNVHGVVYADRFDPFAAFNADDLALISVVAAQTAVTWSKLSAHKRLAR